MHSELKQAESRFSLVFGEIYKYAMALDVEIVSDCAVLFSSVKRFDYEIMHYVLIAGELLS